MFIDGSRRHSDKRLCPYDEDDDELIESYWTSLLPMTPTGSLPPPPIPLTDNKHYVCARYEVDDHDKNVHVMKLVQTSKARPTGKGREVTTFPKLDFQIIEEDPHVAHLCFVVHGIGEALWSRQDIPITDIIDCTNILRNSSRQLLATHPGARKSAEEKGFRGRVEFIPIAWHSVVHDREKEEALDRVTQKTIPYVRALANQVIVDVLHYCDPEQRLMMANKIASQANEVYHLFKKNNPTFEGKISFVAHSLGSVILLDLCRYASPPNGPVDVLDKRDTGLPSVPHTADASPPVPPEVGEVLPVKKIRRKLSDVGAFSPINFDFEIQNFFAIGSPIGFFATVRGNELSPSYQFPTVRHLFNIMHGHDPVAYRIEPAIIPALALTEPVIVPHVRNYNILPLLVNVF